MHVIFYVSKRKAISALYIQNRGFDMNLSCFDQLGDYGQMKRWVGVNRDGGRGGKERGIRKIESEVKWCMEVCFENTLILNF